MWNYHWNIWITYWVSYKRRVFWWDPFCSSAQFSALCCVFVLCLSSSCVFCALFCQCLWIVHSWFSPSVFSNVYIQFLYSVIIAKTKIGLCPWGIGNSSCWGHFGYLAPKNIFIIWFFNLLSLRRSDEG